MIVIGSICARGGSKGVPRKNLRMLRGKPLIVHTIECARGARVLDRVLVSTDDEEIARVARASGAEVPFMRPAHLASDSASKWDVFKHLIDTIEKMDGIQVDVLVDLDTGVPLRDPSDIDQTVERLLQGSADVVVTAYLAERNPYFNMVERTGSDFVALVKRPVAPVVCRQAAPAVYSLSPAVYAIRRSALNEFDHWSQARMDIQEIPRSRGIDIDTEIDFQYVEMLLQKKGGTNE